MGKCILKDVSWGKQLLRWDLKSLFQGNLVRKTSWLDKNSISKNMEKGNCMYRKQQTQKQRNMRMEKQIKVKIVNDLDCQTSTARV